MNEKKEKKGIWKSIWEFTQQYRKNLIIAVIFSLINGITVAAQPLIIKYVIDDGISNIILNNDDKMSHALFYCGLYILVSACRIAVWAIVLKNMLKALEGFLFNIRAKFFSHIQSLCMRFYDKTSSGELFNYIMGTPMNNLKNFLNQVALGLPQQLVALAISLAAMLNYDWLLTVVMLVVLMVSVYLNYRSRYKIKQMSGDLLKSESEASKYIDDVLHGNGAVKMYAIEEQVDHKFKSYIDLLRSKGENLAFSQWVANAKPELTQYIGTAVIYSVGAFSCIYRGLTVGELTAFVSGMGIVSNTMNMWLNINLLRSNAESSLDRINSVLKVRTTTPEEGKFRDIEFEKECAERHNKPCVELKNVSFGYDNRKIFENFNCKMEYNRSFGLVGSSGSGKSTITKLIMRLYEVTEGEILLHGCDIRKYSLHDLRKSIGIVPQEPFIFQMSIYENIRIACPEAAPIEIIKAMEIARVHEFVNDLPQGWNTIVGDGGFGLSGGQKQRIAIARAILGKPDILIFDEATSALDNVSEKHIQTAIEELMKTHTVIIVAHRLTTIRNVDKIFVFDKGKIVQNGTFDSLKNEDGLFKRMLGEPEE